jgi:nucleotide-binding universal stress UspA family protein
LRVDLLVLLLIWLGVVIASTLVVVYFAIRWGRDPFGWALLAAVLGPIALVALVGTRQSATAHPPAFDRSRGQKPAGARSSIIAAVDGSPSSERVARYIANSHPQATDVLLLAVLPAEMKPQGSAQQQRDHDAAVSRATDGASKVLRDAGVPSRVVVGYGNPGEEIVRLAADERADVVVVGRRGAGLTKALLGSVSDSVVKHAKTPVAVID